jgi:hypothetical protein
MDSNETLLENQGTSTPEGGNNQEIFVEID